MVIVIHIFDIIIISQVSNCIILSEFFKIVNLRISCILVIIKIRMCNNRRIQYRILLLYILCHYYYYL